MNTPACRPNAESLTAANAAASSATRSTTSTGPKTSSRADLRLRRHAGQHGRRVRGAVALAADHQLARRRPTASSTHASTRRAASSLIIGPTSVASSDGSPVRSACDGGDEPGQEAVVEPLVHVHPLHRDAALPGLVVGERRDALRGEGQVLVGRPVGADHRRARCRPARGSRASAARTAGSIAPTGPEPVNETTGSRGSATSAAARSLGTGSTENIPGGRSVSARISPSSSAVSGVAGAGLSTIGAPTAIAGATLCATRLSGKLNGEMPEHRAAREPADHRDPAGGRRVGVEPLELAGEAPRLLGGPAERGDAPAPPRPVPT